MLLHTNVTEGIIGGFFEVYRDFGFGFMEAAYANALAVEPGWRGMAVKREVPVELHYRGVLVARYRIDMIVEDRVLVETKATKTLTAADERQVLNYLKATNIEVGLLLHFGPAPGFKRFVYDNERKTGVAR